MKQFGLAIAICLIATSVYAGQQEDIKLCKNRILDEFDENVTGGFNIGEKCKNDTWVFDGWEQFYCIVDRPKNRIYVGKLPYDIEKRKYSGLACANILSLPLNSLFSDNVLDHKKEKAIQARLAKEEELIRQATEKKEKFFIGKADKLCVDYMKNTTGFEAQQSNLRKENDKFIWNTGTISFLFGLAYTDVYCVAKKIYEKNSSSKYNSVQVSVSYAGMTGIVEENLGQITYK